MPAPQKRSKPSVGPALNPTPEQQDIIDACRTGGNLVIQAGAGTGKSSSLRMAAEAMPDKKITYIVYNKAAAEDAKVRMPPNAACSTAHSLAYRKTGVKFRHRLNGPRYPAWKVADALGITRPLDLEVDVRIHPKHLARIAQDTVRSFCYSDAESITGDHVPFQRGITGSLHTDLCTTILPIADQIWADARDEGGTLTYTHDFYLKIWAMDSPTLPGDVIMLDESQDTNPVLARVIHDQEQAQRVLVGDSNQTLYGWRKAMDALGMIEGAETLYLSQSWRFGDRIAEEANMWLAEIGTRLRLRGNPGINSFITTLDEPHAILTRTNAGALLSVMKMLDADRKVAMVGGGTALSRLAEAAASLQEGKGTSHPELYVFPDWAAVQEYSHEESGKDLRTFVGLIDKHGPATVIAATNALVPESRADTVVSTAHSSKGRQWLTVQVGDDFSAPKRDEDIPRTEAMVNYVAITRAQHELDRGSLAWIDDYRERRSVLN